MLIESTAICALTMTIIQVVKKTGKISNNFLPALVMVVAVLLTFLAYTAEYGVSGIASSWASYLLVGLLTGASAIAIYDNVSGPVKEVKARKEDAEIDKPTQSFLENIDKPTER
jgi:hypothetical protein